MIKLNIVKCFLLLFFSISCIYASQKIQSNNLKIWFKGTKQEKEYFDVIIKQFVDSKNNKLNLLNNNKNVTAETSLLSIDVRYDDVNNITKDVANFFHNNFTTLPNIIYTANDLVGYFAINNYILPLEDFTDDGLLRKFDLEALVFGNFYGKQYLIPDLIGNNVVLFYNKNLVKKPNNFQEFYTQATEYMKSNNGYYGLVYPNYSAYYLIGFFNGFNANVFSRSGAITLNNISMQYALELTKELSKLGKNGITKEQAVALFIEGKSAFLLSTTDVVVQLNRQNINFDIMPMLMPFGKNTKNYSSSLGFMVTNTEDSKQKKDLINDFFDFYFQNNRYKALTLARQSVPTTNYVYKDGEVNRNNSIKMIKHSLYTGTMPMPLVPKMRAVWDGIIPNLRKYLNGEITAEEATALMQINADNISTIISNR